MRVNTYISICVARRIATNPQMFLSMPMLNIRDSEHDQNVVQQDFGMSMHPCIVFRDYDMLVGHFIENILFSK